METIPVPDGYVPPPHAEFRARVTISHRSTFRGRGPVAITITDDESGAEFTACLTLEKFAECVTGSARIEADGEAIRAGLVGTVAVSKREAVPFDMHADRGLEAEALAPFEVDGWTAREGDMTNPHNSGKDDCGRKAQAVVFFRNVLKSEVR